MVRFTEKGRYENDARMDRGWFDFECGWRLWTGGVTAGHGRRAADPDERAGEHGEVHGDGEADDPGTDREDHAGNGTNQPDREPVETDR